MSSDLKRRIEFGDGGVGTYTGRNEWPARQPITIRRYVRIIVAWFHLY
jgi:hypothetical protein